MYKDIWAPAVRDIFDCQQEPGNEEDSYAVAVGFVPRHCSLAVAAMLQAFSTNF